jgi:hypothetical protein
MQNFCDEHLPMIEDAITVPTRGGAEAFVDAADIASVAVETLVNPDAHAGAQCAPTGPQSLTISEVADIIADVIGRPVTYNDFDPEAWIGGAIAAGAVPADYAVMLRWVVDCGRILNSKTAASQFRGAIIMGLGLALMEETQFDARNGRIMNPSLAEYHMPVHMDVPEIDVIWTDIPDPHAPMGAHGVGEIGITGTAAAVANAIFNATGKRIRKLPITLDKLM